MKSILFIHDERKLTGPSMQQLPSLFNLKEQDIFHNYTVGFVGNDAIFTLESIIKSIPDVTLMQLPLIGGNHNEDIRPHEN